MVESMMWVAVLLGATAPSDVDPVIAVVNARDAELAEAHGRGDLKAYRAGLSNRYAYIDVGGMRVTADVLQKRRENDERRVVSSETTEREAIRLSETVVLLRGLDHGVATYYGGLPRVGSSRWTAVWVREEDGVWRLVAETATPVREDERLPFVPAAQPDATLDALAGDWTLALQPAMTLRLRAEGGKLIASLDDKRVRFTFSPASATHFFEDDRPFELRVAGDGQSLELVTWGSATKATRVRD